MTFLPQHQGLQLDQPIPRTAQIMESDFLPLAEFPSIFHKPFLVELYTDSSAGKSQLMAGRPTLLTTTTENLQLR